MAAATGGIGLAVSPATATEETAAGEASPWAVVRLLTSPLAATMLAWSSISAGPAGSAGIAAVGKVATEGGSPVTPEARGTLKDV